MAGIYVHVPFCKAKCTYCDFASYPNEVGKAELYFACLYREMKARARELKGKKFDTAYIGGGTPSFVDEKYITGIMRLIKEEFDLSAGAEVTIEINPGTLTEKKFAAYKAAGINRFSVGLQSADDGTLERLNRIHTLSDYLYAARILKGENFSADALIGLKNQTAESVENTLSVIADSGAKHVSVYALKAEDGTPIYTDYLNGELPSEDEVADLYDFTVKYLKKRGYLRYEVSNFAQKGYESRHNLNYWRRCEYVGMGVAASSHVDNCRFTNTEIIDDYVKCILSGHFAEVFREKVEGEDIISEYVMLALRTAEGIDEADFKEKFGVGFSEKFSRVLEKQGKYLDFSGGRIRIKDEFLYVQNSIIIEFM